MPRPRFALLHNGAGLEPWHRRCLAELEPHAELAWAVVSPAPSRRGGARPARGRDVGLPDDIGRVPALPPDRPGTDSPDFILGLGNVVVLPAMAESARHGVWRFEHEVADDERPFFAEVYAGEPVTRAALLALTAVRASVLQEGFFRTDIRSYGRSRECILDAISPWPARACSRVMRDGLAGLPPAIAPATRNELPGGVVRFATRVATRKLALAWQRLFRHPQWNVGVLRRPAATLLDPGAYTGEDVDWVPLYGKAGFLADPFGVERDGRLHVLCEYFDYTESKGRLCLLDPEGLADEPADVLPLPVHASYPYVLDLPEGLYCIPETAEAGEVALYRADRLGEPWEKVAVLLEGFPGVDPTVFRHDGRWWLTCTRQGAQEDAELLAWHAAELTGPWTAHERNPVKTDVRGARPAGPPFVHEGGLYRPAQDCSETYGGRVALQRVTKLTPTEFAEETVAVLAASPRSPFPIGPHTFTAVGDVVLVDGRRTVFVWAAFRAFVAIWARATARRLRRVR